MKQAAVSFILVASLIGLAGCGKGTFSEKASVGKENVFRYPIVTNPTTLDPHVVQDGDTLDLLQNIYDGLVGWSENNEPVGILADNWEIKDGGTTYVFNLKQGVKFHNGREVTAEDFKYGIERTCNPKLQSPTALTYLGDIVGVRERLAGKATEVVGVKVLSPTQLEIRIDKPRPYFLGKLTFATSFPVPKEAVKFDSEMRELKEMVGTGPYKLEKYVENQLIVLAANKDYHGGAPGVSKIERPVIKDAATRLNKYKSGEIDLVMLERQDITKLQADPKYKDHLKFFPRPSLWYVGLNLKGYPAFAKRDVRRAIAMAIDKEKIVKELLEGINLEANSILPPGVFGYRENANVIPYNPAEARKLLASAGYPGGKGIPELTIHYREQRPDIETVASAVATQLRQNLGIKVAQRSLEWRNYLEKHNRKELEFFHMRWAADYLDPENFLSLLLDKDGAENKIWYEDPEYHALIVKANESLDSEERKRLYAQAEDIVLQDAPFIPVYFQRDAELINPKVQGLRESLFGHLPHTTVRMGN